VDEQRECEHCGRPFEVGANLGRPRKYCRRSCRQRAFEARRHLGELGWGEVRIRRASRELAELEDLVDRVRGIVEELRADVEDDAQVDGPRLLSNLERALDGR